MAIGFDCGTYNLITCKRDKDKNFVCKRQINAFLEMKKDNPFLFNILKSKNVGLIEHGDMAYIVGEAAVNMAYSMTDLTLKRPMKDGCVNPNERNAFDVLNIMIHSLLDEIDSDGESLCYSIPANAINQETDAEYHNKILDAIFKAYTSEKGYRVTPMPINEALAIIYAELAHKAYTGIAASFGSGQVNVCFAIYGAPVFKFSIVNSGDWIDKMSAKATGESVTFINQEKTKIDLMATPTTMLERAIQTQYKLMIEHTVAKIKEGLIQAGNKSRTENPIDFIIAGGSSLPNGFDKLFTEIVNQSELPIKINNIIRPNDPINSVAKGCLVAAENATQF